MYSSIPECGTDSMRFWAILHELWKNTPGKVGIVLLCLLVATSLFVIFTYPKNFGAERWSNPSIWADNPKSVAPVWTNALTRIKKMRHITVELAEPDEKNSTRRATESLYYATIDFQADVSPTFLSYSLKDVEYHARPPIITVLLERPDGYELVLDRHVVVGPRRGEESPFLRHDEEALRTVLGSNDQLADDVTALFADEYGFELTRETARDGMLDVLFGVPGDSDTGDSAIVPLQGTYKLTVRMLANHADDTMGQVKVVFGGSIYGIMGTDALGRDLSEGLLYGLPVALLIGISTSIISTLMGMTLGMISGYSGGKIDIAIQRSADIVANVPVLPLLIFLVFVGGSKLWIILLVLVAFSWPGLTIMVRTMVLQLRTGQEVEASRGLGASSGRIIYRHIFPHTASYVLAQLVFFAPSAILAESGLSFLGLGDPSIPTWGQILEYGFRTGAVFLGYWWWVIPPGLLIVITAVTFMFLALGLEPVVDPRLRGRRSWHF